MKSDVYFIKYDENHSKMADKLNDFLLNQSNMLINKNDLVGIKMHFGEKGNKGYIKPNFVKKIADAVKVKKANPFLTDTNTLYCGKRSNSVEHLCLAYGHGFDFKTVETPVIIADGMRGQNFDEVIILDKGLKHFDNFKFAGDIMQADYIINLSHATGHMLSGYGGAIKNIAMGCASRIGKMQQHSDVNPYYSEKNCIKCGQCMKVCPVDAIEEIDGGVRISEKCIGCGECLLACKKFAIQISWSEDTEKIQEKIVEYAYAFFKQKKHKIYNINFLMHFTKNCDCMARDEDVLIDNIGILCGEDPVAIDKASIDLINKKAGYDMFSKIYPKINSNIQIDYSSEIGLGQKVYNLNEVK